MDLQSINTLYPFIGVDQIAFGMTSHEVEALWGAPDRKSTNRLKEKTEFRSGVITTYSEGENGKLVEIAFPRKCISLNIKDIHIYVSPKFDRLKELCVLDNDVFEDVGIIVFKNLGITLGGFLDEDDSDVYVTAFAEGRWDADFPDMKRFHIDES